MKTAFNSNPLLFLPPRVGPPAGRLSWGRQVGHGRHTVPCHQAVTVKGVDMGDMLIHLASNQARRPVCSHVSAHNEQNTHRHIKPCTFEFFQNMCIKFDHLTLNTSCGGIKCVLNNNKSLNKKY